MDLKFRCFRRLDEFSEMIYNVFFKKYGEGWIGGNPSSKFYQIMYGDGNFFGGNEKEITIMQYTGRQDTNKREVYEYDIIGESKVGEPDEVLGVVKYDEDLAAFILEKTNGGWEYLAKYFQFYKHHKIIGNVFENPQMTNKL